jgi:hypothetical protein
MIDVRFRPMGPLAKKTRSNSQFRSKYQTILDKLETELDKLSAKSIVIEAGFELSQIRNDGWPRSAARPSHPDVRLSFNSKGKEMAFPCSTYTSMDDNLYAIALTLERLRDINRYGVTQEGQQYKGFTALPAPAPAGPTRIKAATLLAFLAGDEHSAETVATNTEAREAAYKVVVKKAHPDVGGSRSVWDSVQEAIGVLRG